MSENTETTPAMSKEDIAIQAQGLDLNKFLKNNKEEIQEEILGSGSSEESNDETVEAVEEAAARLAANEDDDESSDNDDVLEEETLDEATQESIKKLLLKIDGKEIEEELPFGVSPEHAEWLTKKLQLSNVAQKRMQEAAEVQKNFEKFINDFKGNPETLMEEMGLNPEEFAEAVISRKIEELQKSPEQVEQEKKDRELQAMRKKIEEMERKEKESQLEQERQQALEEVTSEINAALKEDGRLPENDFVRQRVASLWHNYIINDHDVSAKEVVSQVYSELNELFSNISEALPDKAFEEFVGKKTIDRLRKKRIQKTPETLNKVKETIQEKDKVKSQKKKINLNDWMRNRSGTLSDMLD